MAAPVSHYIIHLLGIKQSTLVRLPSSQRRIASHPFAHAVLAKYTA